ACAGRRPARCRPLCPCPQRRAHRSHDTLRTPCSLVRAQMPSAEAAARATYFITADIAPLGLDGDDVARCRLITIEAGVTAIPVLAFCEGTRRRASSASASRT